MMKKIVLLVMFGVIAVIAATGYTVHHFYPQYTQPVLDRIVMSKMPSLSAMPDFPDMPSIDLSLAPVIDGVRSTTNDTMHKIDDGLEGFVGGIQDTFTSADNAVSSGAVKIQDQFNAVVAYGALSLDNLTNRIGDGASNLYATFVTKPKNYVTSVAQELKNTTMQTTTMALYEMKEWAQEVQQAFTAPTTGSFEFVKVAKSDLFMNDADVANILSNIEPAAGNDELGVPPELENDFMFEVENETISAEAVLVPRAKTVISSSRDGRLKSVNFKNGEVFKKGDILLEYHCADIRAELDAVNSEKQFARQKQLTTSRLFNLELASKMENLEARVDDKKSLAKQKITESRLGDCIIRADYDGRVVKKLANDGEYTRTDRVLMEVASEGTLDVEFLLPSIWLRWVNVDAPLSLELNETGKTYSGAIKRIFGEVDPVSQSIQIRAKMDDYVDPLLPGMSGEITLDVRAIREAGVSGFLETRRIE